MPTEFIEQAPKKGEKKKPKLKKGEIAEAEVVEPTRMQCMIELGGICELEVEIADYWQRQAKKLSRFFPSKKQMMSAVNDNNTMLSMSLDDIVISSLSFPANLFNLY